MTADQSVLLPTFRQGRLAGKRWSTPRRPDVDASALTGYGVSQGGYWITKGGGLRVANGCGSRRSGMVDVSAGWTVHLPKALLDLLDSGQKDAFNAAMAKAQASADPKAARRLAFRSKPYGVIDPFDLFAEVRKYQVRDVAGQITRPLLVLDPDGEQFFPGQPRALCDLLPHRAPADPHADAGLAVGPPALPAGPRGIRRPPPRCLTLSK